mgnify:CR=1 FL=1
MTDTERYQAVRKEWLCGAGGSIQVRAVLWMLDALSAGYGASFRVHAACSALRGLSGVALAIEKDLSKSSEDVQS